ncbi:phosphoribosylaminoimidazole carboxylase ade2 [Batrachochytrium dendrobatidis]|nr:phosphoribosylaminoimidazole carboxylase ade2 [Batrachochytrium dendrobatidis]KAK5670920.1 phosphoribosylaminoimidazole carboxylase ade2 [Batrachochytrium dendrobatidis]
MDQRVVGILGGGQLGRMLTEAANRLNVQVAILDEENSPATQISTSPRHIQGSFKDPIKIAQLAAVSQVLTVEIEHVDALSLEQIQTKTGVVVHPSPDTIRIIQDKYVQKKYLTEHAPTVPIAPFREVVAGSELDSILEAAMEFEYPMMLKSKTLAYDGRGNKVIKNADEIQIAIDALGGGASKGGPGLYVEKWVSFVRELAVMVARSTTGEISSYPCVETVQSNNICHLVIAPAQIDGRIAAKARFIAEDAVAALNGAGIYGVEMFLLSDDSLSFNEIAPRPHNSGHYTIEACHTSQFEQHLRCILGMPLGSPALKVSASIMINIIGTGSGDAALKETLEACQTSLAIPGATVHLYGKSGVRKGRKMGHITLIGETMSDVIANTKDILKRVPGSVASDLSVDDSEPRLWEKASPLVGVIMGSDSDLPAMRAAALILKGFGVPFELTIVSAHRTPDRMMEYAKSAHERGLKIIIAAAGGAAHLPGMVAAITPLPVIGVPISLKVLDGVDSLHSIVQMPRGVPVATVAINNSTNAALLAIRILGAHMPSYLAQLQEYSKLQEEEVLNKVNRLAEVGWEDYHV